MHGARRWYASTYNFEGVLVYDIASDFKSNIGQK